MRLQLTIQRQGLPQANILWNVRPLIRPSSASTTISQFLEQVNDIIPLEADEWGLEDYAVEVKGFECLHFSELHQVLKEDDEVWYVLHETSGLIHVQIRELTKVVYDHCKRQIYV